MLKLQLVIFLSVLVFGIIFEVQHTASASNFSATANWLTEGLNRTQEAIEEGNSTEAIRVLNKTQSFVNNNIPEEIFTADDPADQKYIKHWMATCLAGIGALNAFCICAADRDIVSCGKQAEFLGYKFN